jgi:hypothetical protein
MHPLRLFWVMSCKFSVDWVGCREWTQRTVGYVGFGYEYCMDLRPCRGLSRSRRAAAAENFTTPPPPKNACRRAAAVILLGAPPKRCRHVHFST